MKGSSLACESRTRFAVRRILSLPANPATSRDFFPLASQKERGLCSVKKLPFLSKFNNHSHVTRMAFSLNVFNRCTMEHPLLESDCWSRVRESTEVIPEMFVA